MGKTPQISNAVAVPSISRHFFPAKLFVWPLVLTILFPFLPLTESWAAIVEHCSLRSIGKVVEIQFTMDGKSPTWHLVPHQQELWLNLEHSEVSASVELAAVPAIFPLTNVRMRDFRGGDVRLVIHVRGEVDYAVAQMPHVLVVRIAPSGAVADLGQRLFAQMEQSRSIRPASSAPKRSHHRASSPTVATFRRHVGTAVPAQARINPVPPNVHPPISPNEPASSISTSR
ncbi:MAG TPA: hypothetical protein VJ728_14530, partial [Candidatus Binataceae bacterium]|nr:hypothetical protein [Candidatus Binataceae bacterium]